jgi:hypothetical protein
MVKSRALTRYWITSGRGTRANAAPETKYHSEKKYRFYVPESLLEKWHMTVDPNVSGAA